MANYVNMVWYISSAILTICEAVSLGVSMNACEAGKESQYS